MTVKKIITGMSFIFSIGPSRPISEIATSHVYKLNKKTRNEGDLKSRFFNQESEVTVSYILIAKWLSGCSEVGDHEIYQE